MVSLTAMGRVMSVSGSVTIAVSAEEAYVGMRFVGDNRRGPVSWQTGCKVTAADRGRRFAFDVDRYGKGRLMRPVSVASWSYDFRPVDEGTLVTETWTDGRALWPDFATRMFDPIATRRASFAEFQEGNIRRTLARLKRELESEST